MLFSSKSITRVAGWGGSHVLLFITYLLRISEPYNVILLTVIDIHICVDDVFLDNQI